MTWLTISLLIAEILLQIGLTLRVVMRRRPVGVSLAWLMVVWIFPFVGAVIYLLIGELRLGNRRAEWAEKIHGPYDRWLAELRKRFCVEWSAHAPGCEPLSRLVESSVGIPAAPGNDIQLLENAEQVIAALLADIAAARRTCHMEFYIWSRGGLADDVVEALLAAAARGVLCRILVDDVGSREFLDSDQAARLRDGGVFVQSALQVGLFRMLFVRFDLRLHRKIVVIDGEIGYTGSLNLADPRFFKKDEGVGEWIDAMVRLRGPAVEPLAATFLEDWELETDEGIETLAHTGDMHSLAECGSSIVQVIPSGPLLENDSIHHILLMAIYAARRELILTTPYFILDEPLLAALTTAARRGVAVTVIVPKQVDSFLVRYASQAYQDDLAQAGVQVAQFHGGLLHTKSITVDGEFSLFGSLNIDPRSLHLNFEITLAIYDRDFTQRLRTLQQTYLSQTTRFDLAVSQRRSFRRRLLENVARLFAPLL